MKRNIYYLSILLILIVSACTHVEDLPEPVNTNVIEETSARISKGDVNYYIMTSLTIKYRDKITDHEKHLLRTARYDFEIISVQPTLCENVEIWHVRFPEPPGQNGYTQGNVDMERGNSGFDLYDYAVRIELNWVG